MKEFFSDKKNILLTILFGLVIAILISLLYLFLMPKSVTIPDFKDYNESQIVEWLKENNVKEDKYKINHEFSDDIEEGKLISQNPKAGEILKDVLEIVISKGIDPDKEIEYLKQDNLTKDELDKWFNENHFTNVSYEYVIDKDKAKDVVIKITPSNKAKRSDEVVVTLSAGEDIENVEIVVPDFTNSNRNQIKQWADTNLMNVKFNYEYSDEAIGKVIRQSVNAGEKIKAGSEIVITISDGKGITLKDLAGNTKAEAQKWCDNNGVYSSFIEIYDDSVKEGIVIYTSPKANSSIAEKSTVKIYLSKGKDPSNQKVRVDANRIGKTEKEFTDYIKGLGLTPVKENQGYYSTTIKKDTIYSYDDGEFNKGSSIKYALSLGEYVLDLSKIEGKTKSEASSYASNINAMNGHLNITYTDTYDSRAKGTVFGCTSSKSGINTNVSCKVSLGEKENTPTPTTYAIENYVGKNSPCSGSSCTIHNGNITIKVTDAYSDKAVGTIISQSPGAGNYQAGTTINLTKSIGPEPSKTAYIPSITVLDSSPATTYQEKANAVSAALSEFTNVSISSSTSQSFSAGTIISVSVNGNTGYSPGNYPTDTPIVVVISSGFE